MGFRSWFFSPVAGGETYSPAPSNIAADTNSTVHSNAVDLTDATYPAEIYHREQSPVFGNDYVQNPDYDASDDGTAAHTEVIFTPGQYREYAFQQAGIGQVDRTVPQNYGSIPGTLNRVIVHGPVSGFPMDEWQEGNRANIGSNRVGNYGPVTGFGGPDYASQASLSYYQTMFQDYNTDAATDAVIASV